MIWGYEQRLLRVRPLPPHRLTLSPFLSLPLYQQAGTPAPYTPGADLAAAAAASTHQPPEQATAAAPAPAPAVLADDILAFDFGGAADRVLTGHAALVEESAALSAPVTDSIQEQLLVLDQVGAGLDEACGGRWVLAGRNGHGSTGCCAA